MCSAKRTLPSCSLPNVTALLIPGNSGMKSLGLMELRIRISIAQDLPMRFSWQSSAENKRGAQAAGLSCLAARQTQVRRAVVESDGGFTQAWF